jgi:hypothetical protein
MVLDRVLARIGPDPITPTSIQHYSVFIPREKATWFATGSLKPSQAYEGYLGSKASARKNLGTLADC